MSSRGLTNLSGAVLLLKGVLAALKAEDPVNIIVFSDGQVTDKEETIRYVRRAVAATLNPRQCASPTLQH